MNRPLSAPRRPVAAHVATPSDATSGGDSLLLSCTPVAHSSSTTSLPVEIVEKARALKRGAIVVSAVAVRRVNVSPHTLTEYVVSLSPPCPPGTFKAMPQITSEASRAVHDLAAGGWTLTFRDVHAIFPVDDSFDGSQGVIATVHSTCGRFHFGSATCRAQREWCALSRPRGEVQLVFQRVYPQHAPLAASHGAAPQQQLPAGPTSQLAARPSTAAHQRLGHVQRPNTASALGRAPLGSLNYTPFGSTVSTGPVGGNRFPPSPPRTDAAAAPSTVRLVNGTSGSMEPSKAAAAVGTRTVIFSDWVLEGLPPAPAALEGRRYCVFLAVRYAHAEMHVYPPALVEGGRTHKATAGLTSSSSSSDDEGSAAGRTEATSARQRGLMAVWPSSGASLPFDVPLHVQQSPIVVSVFACDDSQQPRDAASSATTSKILLAESSCDMHLVPQDGCVVSFTPRGGRGEGSGTPLPPKEARRCSLAGGMILSFTTQVFQHEAQKEGAGGRPTSAFPRRGGGVGAHPAAQQPPPAAALRHNDVGGSRPEEGAAVPNDDFVVRDVDDDDDDDDDDDWVPPAPKKAGGASQANSHQESDHAKITANSKRNAQAALNQFAAAFEAKLHTTLKSSFQTILERLRTIETRVSSVEERIQCHLANSHGGGGGGSTGRPTSASDVGNATPGADSSMQPTTPHTPPQHHHHPPMSSAFLQPTATAGCSSRAPMSASRPNSSDSYRGVALYPETAFPEHGNPLYTEHHLEQRFRSYDAEGRGLLTKAQLVHFYRTHNSFSFDETNDDIHEELRRFAPRLDEDAVTFNEFSLVALRLAKF